MHGQQPLDVPAGLDQQLAHKPSPPADPPHPKLEGVLAAQDSSTSHLPVTRTDFLFSLVPLLCHNQTSMPCMSCLLQIFHPDKFQEYVLGQRGSDTVVQGPKQLAFTDFYMPATGELVKDVFAQEATGVITQGLNQEGGYTAFGEQGTGAV